MAEHRVIETKSLNAWMPYFNKNGSLYGNDGRYFSNLITFRNINHPDEIIFEIEWDTTDFSQTYSLGDWHPDNERILIRHLSNFSETENPDSEISLYNVLTETQETLMSGNADNYYSGGDFNADGSQIVFGLHNAATTQIQIVLYDMENREEIALPLFGNNPRWVNGGR